MQAQGLGVTRPTEGRGTQTRTPILASETLEVRATGLRPGHGPLLRQR